MVRPHEDNLGKGGIPGCNQGTRAPIQDPRWRHAQIVEIRALMGEKERVHPMLSLAVPPTRSPWPPLSDPAELNPRAAPSSSAQW